MKLNELQKYRIGSDEHSVASSYLRERGITQLYNIKSQNYFKLLERGRIDLVPYTDFSLAFSNQRQGIAQGDIVAVIELPELSKPLYIAASRKTKPALIQTIKAAYAETVTSGKFEEIMAPLQLRIDNLTKR